MSNLIGTAYVAIRPETSAFRNETARTVTRDASKAGDQAGRAFSTSFRKSGIVAFGAGFLAGGAVIRQVTQLTKVSIQAASNVEEQTNKIRVVFGDAADSITSWAETTGRSLGIAEDEALAAAGTFGNLFRVIGIAPQAGAEMSKTLVQLSADLASFNNADPSEVLQAIRSGLVGEVEPLRRFGILLSETRVQQVALSQTGKENVKALTQQEKAAARYTLILRDTGTAQGDFARTSDSLANQQRILSASIRNTQAVVGTALLPVVTEITRGLSDWFSSTENQERIQRDVTQAVKEGTQIIRGLVTVMRQFRDVLTPVIDLLGGFEKAAELAFGLFLVRKLTRATAAMRTFGVAAGQASVASAAGGAGAGGGRLGGLKSFLPAVAVVGGFEAANAALGPGGRSALNDLGGAIHDFNNSIEGEIAAIQESEEFITRRRDQLLAALHATPEFQAQQIRAPGEEGVRIEPGIRITAEADAAAKAAKRARETTSFALRSLRAEATKQTQDDLALFRERQTFLQNQISRLEQAGLRGKNDRIRLEGLYGELSSINGEIDSLQEQAQQEREAAVQAERDRLREQFGLEEQRLEVAQSTARLRGNESVIRKATNDEIALLRQRASDSRLDESERLAYALQLNDAIQARRDADKEIRDAEKQDLLDRFATQDEFIGLRKQRAALTTKNLKDDRAAVKAEIKLLRERLREEGLTGSERRGIQSRILSARQELQGIRGQGAQQQGASVGEFFAAAVNTFRQQGSNIAGRTGVLSAQDARASFAFNAVQRIGDRAQAVAQTQRTAQLTEQQRTNVLLANIYTALSPGRRPQQKRPVGARTSSGESIYEAMDQARQVVN